MAVLSADTQVEKRVQASGTTLAGNKLFQLQGKISKPLTFFMLSGLSLTCAYVSASIPVR